MIGKHRLAAWLVVCSICSAALAGPAAPLKALARMPVREITVFKDGHALLLHSGKMPTDGAGNVVLDYLPAPVLGTFWPYSADKAVKLRAVVAGKRKVRVERTALSLRELIEANAGAKVIVTEKPAGGRDRPTSYEATIIGCPARSGQEQEETSPPNGGEKLPRKGGIVLLKTADGRKVVDLARVMDVTFKDAHRAKVSQEEFRNLLTLKLDWGAKKPAKTAAVGMLYLQRGVRWIPNYKVTIDGKGGAAVKLQGTLINELTDLKDVTMHLVVGVPTFAFKESADPISLRETIARLSRQFRPRAQTAFAMSNAIMTQAPMMARPSGPSPRVNLGPQIGPAGQSEDLYTFTVKHVTLRKGQRMVLSIAEFPLKYKDIYTLDIPITPPLEVYRRFNQSRQDQVARLLRSAKAMHKIRLTNTSKHPLTTAPALILKGDRVLAQGMMRYTSVGADTDLSITTAVNIHVKKTGKETKRTPDAVNWDGHRYRRIDLAGKIELTNFGDKAVKIDVRRFIIGQVGEADHGGKAVMIDMFDDDPYFTTTSRAVWWSWYSWPYWWSHFNGIGRVSWTVKLEPGKGVDLNYAWHYFWR